MSELLQAQRHHEVALEKHAEALRREVKARSAMDAARDQAEKTASLHREAIARCDDLIAAAARGEMVSARDLVQARNAATEPGALVELHAAAASRAEDLHRAAWEATRRAVRALEGRADVLRQHRRIAAAAKLDRALAEAENAIAELAELGPHHARRYFLHLSDHPVRVSSSDETDVRRKLGSAEAAERAAPLPRVVAA